MYLYRTTIHTFYLGNLKLIFSSTQVSLGLSDPEHVTRQALATSEIVFPTLLIEQIRQDAFLCSSNFQESKQVSGQCQSQHVTRHIRVTPESYPVQ